MAGGSRPGSGRRAVNINLVELEKLCGLQCTDAEVASFFKVSARTIERRKKQPAFADAMERGRAAGRLSVRRMLFGQAAKGNVAAAIFLSKNLLGYKDFVTNELSGPNGHQHGRKDHQRSRPQQQQSREDHVQRPLGGVVAGRTHGGSCIGR